MEQEKNSLFYKLPPELNKILINGLNKCYIVYWCHWCNRKDPKENEIVGIFLSLNDAWMALMKMTGNVHKGYVNTYDEKEDKWILPELIHWNYINKSYFCDCVIKAVKIDSFPLFDAIVITYRLGFYNHRHKVMPCATKTFGANLREGLTERQFELIPDFKPMLSFIKTLEDHVDKIYCHYKFKDKQGNLRENNCCINIGQITMDDGLIYCQPHYEKLTRKIKT